MAGFLLLQHWQFWHEDNKINPTIIYWLPITNTVCALQVNSLNEKLSAKDVAGALAPGQSSHALHEEETRDSSLGFVVKVEDRLSSGSGGSAVVDEDGPQLVDSGHSYFHCDDYPGCLVAIDGVQSEEDDGSDDGRVYCAGIFAAAEEPHQEGGEPLGWWAWP